MPYLLEELIVTRVDLVSEGANSAAFIELFKGKERGDKVDINDIISKMKPEHAQEVTALLEKNKQDIEKAQNDLKIALGDLGTAQQDLNKANETIVTLTGDLQKSNEKIASLEGVNKSVSFEESEVFKALPDAVRAEITKMRIQKEAAEEELRKSNEAKIESDAVAKAAGLKALPLPQETLVKLVKSATPEMIDALGVINAAIEKTVLTPAGGDGDTSVAVAKEAWDKIEAEAEKIAKAREITHEQAVSAVIKEQPELYRQYLKGGAN